MRNQDKAKLERGRFAVKRDELAPSFQQIAGGLNQRGGAWSAADYTTPSKRRIAALRPSLKLECLTQVEDHSMRYCPAAKQAWMKGGLAARLPITAS